MHCCMRKLGSVSAQLSDRELLREYSRNAICQTQYVNAIFTDAQPLTSLEVPSAAPGIVPGPAYCTCQRGNVIGGPPSRAAAAARIEKLLGPRNALGTKCTECTAGGTASFFRECPASVFAERSGREGRCRFGQVPARQKCGMPRVPYPRVCVAGVRRP